MIRPVLTVTPSMSVDGRAYPVTAAIHACGAQPWPASSRSASSVSIARSSVTRPAWERS